MIRVLTLCIASFVLFGCSKYVIIESPKDVGSSYCLRKPGSDPVHIRKLASDSILVNRGKVILGETHNNKAQHGVCGPSSELLRQGDEMEIGEVSAHQLTFQLKRAVQGQLIDVFEQPLLLKGFNGYSMVGQGIQRGSTVAYDYYVLLADEHFGHPVDPDSANLEKYYRLEVFPTIENVQSARCVIERPDMTFPMVLPNVVAYSLLNITAWNGDKHVCDDAFQVLEAETGGGGEHHP